MFYCLNKHTVLQAILIGCLLVLSGFKIFARMTLLPADGQMVLYQLIYPLWQNHPVYCKIFAMLLLLVEVSLIQGYYHVNSFADAPTLMPAFFFLLLMNAGNAIEVFTPACFTLVFFTLILFVNLNVDRDRPLKNTVFFSGIGVGISILFDPVAVWIAAFVILAMLVNRCLGLKELIILLSGMLTTFLYLFAIYFLSDSLPQLKSALVRYPYFAAFHHSALWHVKDIVRIIYVGLLAAYMVVTLKLFYDNRLIVLRKRLVVIHLLLFVSVLMLFSSMFGLRSGFIYLFIPITLYFSMLSFLKNRRILHDILLIVFFILACL